MAQTQAIQCVKCGRILGSLETLSGEFKGVSYNQDDKDKDKDKIAKHKDKDKIAKHKANKKSSFNLVDNAAEAVRATVTCACGQVNGIY